MGANDHHGLGGEFGFLRRPYGVLAWSTKKSRFTTRTTPCRISYVRVLRTISTGTEKILSQLSFIDGTKRKALSPTVMIMATMTMNDDDNAGNDDGDDGDDEDGDDGDNGDDGNDDDDDGNKDGGGSKDVINHDGGNNDETMTRRWRQQQRWRS